MRMQRCIAIVPVHGPLSSAFGGALGTQVAPSLVASPGSPCRMWNPLDRWLLGKLSSASCLPPVTASVTSITIQTTPASLNQLPLQGTVGLPATVAGTGAYSNAVSWSVNGIANGSAASGTITPASSGVTYTAPAAPPTNPSITITATSAADTTKSASVAVTVLSPVLSTPAIASALPLTPISLPTTGVNPRLPVQITYTDAGGGAFQVTLPAISVGADGGVVAAVPLFVDPASQAIGPGNVNVTITQSGITTQPVALSIADLPSVRSYGMNPEDIAKAVLNFNATQVSHRINALQAVQAAQGNTVDTGSAMQSLHSVLTTTIAARSDVDRLAKDQTLSIPAATLMDGTSVSFDAAGLDMMERVQAIFLSETFGKLAVSTIPGGNAVPAHRQAKVHLVRRLGAGPGWRPVAGVPRGIPGTRSASFRPLGSSQLTGLQQVLLAMGGLATAGQLPLDTVKTVNAESLATEITAVADGLSGLAAFTSDAAKAEGLPKSFVAGSKVVGAIAGLITTVSTVTHCWQDDGMWLYAEATGDTATANLIAQDMTMIPDLYGSLKTLVSSPFLIEEGAAATVIGAASTVWDLVTTGIEYYDLAKNEPSTNAQASSDNFVTTTVSNTDGAIFAAPNGGIVQLEGQVNVSSTAGTDAPLDGIELSPAPGGSNIDAVSDAFGAFTTFLPLGVPSFDYSNATFDIVDPLSQTMLGGEVVNLTGPLTTPVFLPTITATSTCNDSDAGSPDGDDPDCD